MIKIFNTLINKQIRYFLSLALIAMMLQPYYKTIKKSAKTFNKQKNSD